MAIVTLDTLKKQVKSRSDMQFSNFIADDELTLYINQSYEELYDFLILAWEDYVLSSFEFTLSGTTDGYAVPDNVYKLRGIDRQISGANSWATVSRYNFNERNQFLSPWGLISRAIYPSVMYSWSGANIQFIPQTQAAGVYQLWYIPVLDWLVNGSDFILPSLSKFSEYIIVDAAIKCLNKEESDVSVLIMMLEGIKNRIQGMVPNKDDAQPSQMKSWQNAESSYSAFWSRGIY